MDTNNERARRHRAKKRGEEVQSGKPGPKKGYKQSAEHVSKRKRFGAEHANWVGESVSERGGRTRALRTYRDVGPCVLCGSEKSERHHIDGDTGNNDASNILIVCRRCHMKSDGRLEAFKHLAIANVKKAVELAAAVKKAKTHCCRGHEFTPENTYFNGTSRVCKTCRKLHKHNYRNRTTKKTEL